MYINLATAVLDDLLANGQAHTDTIWVRIFCPLQFAKQSEQLAHLILLDPLPRIANMHL